MLLQLPSSHAQTAAPEMAPDPAEILVFEQMRVSRWLARPWFGRLRSPVSIRLT